MGVEGRILDLRIRWLVGCWGCRSQSIEMVDVVGNGDIRVGVIYF